MVSIDALAGMACDYYQQLQIEKAKVQQLTAAVQSRDQKIAAFEASAVDQDAADGAQ